MYPGSQTKTEDTMPPQSESISKNSSTEFPSGHSRADSSQLPSLRELLTRIEQSFQEERVRNYYQSMTPYSQSFDGQRRQNPLDRASSSGSLLTNSPIPGSPLSHRSDVPLTSKGLHNNLSSFSWSRQHPWYNEFRSADPLEHRRGGHTTSFIPPPPLLPQPTSSTTLISHQESNDQSAQKDKEKESLSIRPQSVSESDTQSDDMHSNCSQSTADSTKRKKSSCAEVPRRYLCTFCDKRFTRPSTLKTHMNSHSGLKPFKCPHPNCSWRFTVLSNMKRHEKTCVMGKLSFSEAQAGETSKMPT